MEAGDWECWWLDRNNQCGIMQIFFEVVAIFFIVFCIIIGVLSVPLLLNGLDKLLEIRVKNNNDNACHKANLNGSFIDIKYADDMTMY